MQICGRFPQFVLCLLATFCWLLVAQPAQSVPLPTEPTNVPTWFYESDQAAASLGYSVSGAGDVNGDGYEDVLVGAPKYNSGTYKAGTVFAFYGSAGGLTPWPNWSFGGDQTGGDFGFSVAAAGDVNHDGYADILIGAPRYNGDQSREGRVYGFYGSATGLSASPDWQIEGDLVDAYLGWSVAPAGDVNNDSYDDVIVGAKWAADTFTNEGMVQLYLGGAAGLSSAPVWTRFGGQPGASLGTAVSAAGDLNQDNYDDFLVGVPLHNGSQEDAGQVLIFCGNSSGQPGEPCQTINGSKLDERLGEAVSGIGDITGDGTAEFIIGAPGQDAATVYSGLNSSPIWTAVSGQENTQFGTAVHLSDINGDSYADAIIGAFTYSADQATEGKIFVYYGGITGLDATPSWIAEGNKAEAEFGFALGTSDVDGDAQAELLVGSPNYRKETELRGRAFLFEGIPGSDPTHHLFLPLITNQ